MMLLRLYPGFPLFLVCVAWYSPVVAAGVNRTIDDSFGDSVTGQAVSYLPTTGAIWDDQTCGTKCALHPDVSQAFKGTYTAATYRPDQGPISITIQFTGTSIYVFFILANNAGNGITTSTAANFTLDTASPHLYQHNPDPANHNFQYQQLVYSQENLGNVDHTLVISCSGPAQSFVNFDYAIYTFEDATPPTPPTPPSLPVGGGSGTTTVTDTTTSTLLIPDSLASSVNNPTPTLTPTAPSSSTPSSPVTSNSGSPTTQLVSSNPAPNSATSSTTTAASTSTSDLGQSGGTTKIHVSTRVIVGGVIGGVAVVALIIFILYLLRRSGNCSRRSEELMSEMKPEGGHKIGSVSPFTIQNTPSVPQLAGRDSDTSPGADIKLRPPFHSPHRSAGSMDIMTAYGDPLDSVSSSSSAQTGALRPLRRGQLVLVNDDHAAISQGALSTDSSQTAEQIGYARKIRQKELDERLRGAQREMTYLASDIDNAEKTGYKRLSVPRQHMGTTGNGTSGEMSVPEMKEQLNSLKEQIAYLQAQQRSELVSSVSDAPPAY